MRIFVCEFVTGGGLRNKPLPETLAREVAMMRDALIGDLADLPDVEVLITLDDRLPVPRQAVATPIRRGDDPWRIWAELARRCDAVWPIAPETDGALEALERLIEQSGARSLGCSAKAIAVAASKRASWEAFRRRGVPAVPTWLSHEVPEDATGPFVTKPDHGAGCEDTHLCEERPEGEPGVVIQPYVEGVAASLTVLGRNNDVHVLSANRQHITIENRRFRFGGVTVGGIRMRPGLCQLARQVASAIPGLAGIFGIDLIFAKGGPCIVEVNPRLTTSYVGLRRALNVNPAVLVLETGAIKTLPVAAEAISVMLAPLGQL